MVRVYNNGFGGDGLLNGAALLAISSVGMLNNLKTYNEVTENEEEPTIYLCCLDFTSDSYDKTRWMSMAKAYKDYFDVVFNEPGAEATIKKMNVKTDSRIEDIVHFNREGRKSLANKFKDREKMALGFYAEEMDLDIFKGIYGKQNIGEVYHSDADFTTLYEGNDPNDFVIVIDNGGYKGGGTAATLIPIEIGEFMGDNWRKFIVVSGPSTSFKTERLIKDETGKELRLPEGYNNPIDMFDAEKILKNMDKLTQDKDEKAIIVALQDIVSELRGHSDLNPQYYMGRFIDRIRSDTSIGKAHATVINMKPDCLAGNIFKYDITSDEFQPDNQKHDLHITNLLNALTIQEVIVNYSSLSKNQIHTFCASPGVAAIKKYTLAGIFNANDARKFYRFLVFSAVLVQYVYPCFDNLSLGCSEKLVNCWAQERKKLIGWELPLDTRTTEGNNNSAFAASVRKELAKFLYEYVRSTLNVFMDIQKVSDKSSDRPDVDFFSKAPVPDNSPDFNEGIFEIVNGMIEAIQSSDANTYVVKYIRTEVGDAGKISTDIMDKVKKMIAALGKGQGERLDKDYKNALKALSGSDGTGNDFFSRYAENFPTFGEIKKGHRVWNSDVDIADEAKKYCKRIIRHTYKNIEDFWV